MKTRIRQKIEWAKQMIEMHTDEYGFDGKEKHQTRIHELKGMIEGLQTLL